MAKKSDILVYTPVGFVGNDDAARTFAGPECDMLIGAQVSIEEGGYPIKLRLKNTLVSRGQYDVVSGSRSGWGVTEEGRDEFYRGVRRLGTIGIDVDVDTWPSGPTKSLYNVLFNSGDLSAGFGGMATGDLDRFPANRNLENFLALYDDVRRHDAVMGVGSRNVPVILSYNRENAHLRRIFEGTVNMAVRHASQISGNGVVVNDDDAPEDPAYNKHGDFVTGVYVFNSGKLDFANQLVGTARTNGFFGFEDEYSMMMRAPRHGPVVSRYFESVPNPFEEVSIDDERKTIMERQISAPLSHLPLEDQRFLVDVIRTQREGLQPFYESEQIEEVTGRMLEELSE